MKIAIVHDWLVTYAGSEQVLEQMLALYPDASLFSLVDFLPAHQRHLILNKKVHTSFIQNLPFAQKHYRSYLPLMPFAIEQLDVSAYDLILSSSHAVAKGVRKRSGQLHICYCHTPMRYAWDLRDQYLRETGLDKGLKGSLTRLLLRRLQAWDARTSKSVDHFIANSLYIAERIKRAYGRDAAVIYPPVDIERFSLCTTKEDFYLAASRMVPYKKMGLIVDAFSKMPDKKLFVIGDGPELSTVRARSKKNIEILGYQETNTLKAYMQKARAFIFAAEEDFGIVPVEAQACGTPVIAYGKGGVLETVREWKTGIFFRNQSPDSLVEAVRDFERRYDSFDPWEIRNNAERFGQERFRKEFEEFIENKIGEFKASLR